MSLSPMMQHYMKIKQRYDDCLLFYRLGDFYEMFFEDAETASRELQLTLTGRDCGLTERAPMCGVPYHAVATYINRLLEKNYKVAICEQLTDPKEAVGLVERDVIRVVTPGTVIEDEILSQRENNFLASIVLEKNTCGVAWADVSTGEFNVTSVRTTLELDLLTDLLIKIAPTEIICDPEFFKHSGKIPEYTVKQLRPFSHADEVFKKTDTQGFKARFKDAEPYLKGQAVLTKAAASLWTYLEETQKNSLDHMRSLKYLEDKNYLFLDAAAVRNLELFRSMADHSTKNTLFSLIDKSRTPMGTRKMHAWLERPLRDKFAIEERLDAVEEIKNNFALREDIRLALNDICDIERICTRVAYETVRPKETVHIRTTLKKLPAVKAFLNAVSSKLLVACRDNIDTLDEICEVLEKAICDDPNDAIEEGGYIREGYCEELDRQRNISDYVTKKLIEIEQNERELTGIKTLKIKYSRVFGYMIEVTNSLKDKVPLDRYHRRQTLAGSERYVTEELERCDAEISGSDERAKKLEQEIFAKIRKMLADSLQSLMRTADAVAEVDALSAFAQLADESTYCRPSINTEGKIQITDGRHPVVESIQHDGSFVPNDTYLDNENDRFSVITGPNMAGKSTYMRQVALITLLAHMGSFVPAREADISICDRIFTRVGASDDLSAGQSTFMLEMTEVAGILKNATRDSLIILDEVGRGTSTFDGLSIAWAVTEYISSKNNIGAKTLFATHYHELSELEGTLEGVKNYCITAKEYGEDVIFLRKIVRGSADKSFGIAVAHLAGIPKPILKRAKDILADLEKADITRASKEPTAMQTMMFISDNVTDIVAELKEIDINTLTPLQAMNLLCELREKARREV